MWQGMEAVVVVMWWSGTSAKRQQLGICKRGPSHYSNYHNTRPTRSWGIKKIRLWGRVKLHRCLRVVWLVTLAAVGLYVISTLRALQDATVCSEEKRPFHSLDQRVRDN
jgi:hypothetical protein